MITRLVRPVTTSRAVSRIAASGGTRPDRNAGRIAERVVIIVPTKTVEKIALELIVRPVVGISSPIAFNSALNA